MHPGGPPASGFNIGCIPGCASSCSHPAGRRLQGGKGWGSAAPCSRGRGHGYFPVQPGVGWGPSEPSDFTASPLPPWTPKQRSYSPRREEGVCSCTTKLGEFWSQMGKSLGSTSTNRSAPSPQRPKGDRAPQCTCKSGETLNFNPLADNYT